MNDELKNIQRRGLMLVLSSPSGAGKTTLSRMLLESETGIEMSVSVTTREMRPGEVDGQDYHFKTPDQFAALRDTITDPTRLISLPMHINDSAFAAAAAQTFLDLARA